MRKKVEFESNGITLSGALELPESELRCYALFAHCFTCSKNVHAAVNIAEALSLEGIAVLRFDFTGLGQSEGEFAETHFSSNVSDLVAAAAYLRQEHQAPDILVGHSLGGTAVLAAAHGLSVGTYTSPHLEAVEERIAYNSVPATPEEFAQAVADTAAFDRLIDDDPEKRLTYFEFSTAVGFSWFADRAVELAVIEVGLGGRLDATNVLPATVHSCQVESHVFHNHAVFRQTGLRFCVAFAGFQHHLAGDAAHTQASPTQAVVLVHARHAHARLRCSDRRHIPTRPGTKYDEIVFAF